MKYLKYVAVVILLTVSHLYAAHSGIVYGNKHGLKMADNLLLKCANEVSNEPLTSEQIAKDIGLVNDRLTTNMAYGYLSAKVLRCYVTEMDQQ